ncbi:uncharacterized protein LOC126837305 isoform X1 [Adelges cooleyi]|uniref:uncharacterized protein LOC126837305 isoform X1 n=1 Tax=Adelges cooleyi TaxID=133065 RepID=UPI00217F6EC3|nr:uncharacterized protein LOC126837305 isoform X1 [Adelges cooleyi]
MQTSMILFFAISINIISHSFELSSENLNTSSTPPQSIDKYYESEMENQLFNIKKNSISNMWIGHIIATQMDGFVPFFYDNPKFTEDGQIYKGHLIEQDSWAVQNNFEKLPLLFVINQLLGHDLHALKTNITVPYENAAIQNDTQFECERGVDIAMDNKSKQFNRTNYIVQNAAKCNSPTDFQTPTKLLGKCFDVKVVQHLCETVAIINRNTIDKMHFTSNGKRICRSVCCQQYKIMIPIKPSKIVFLQSFCRKVDCQLATCVCAFKIVTGENISFTFFHFTANALGQLAMVYFEV